MKLKSCLQHLLLSLWLVTTSLAAQGEYSVQQEAGVRAEMRDGVWLVADIFRPDQDGTFPVLL